MPYAMAIPNQPLQNCGAFNKFNNKMVGQDEKELNRAARIHRGGQE
jgi:hypothetical protein